MKREVLPATPMSDNGGWLKNTLMWDYMNLVSDGYPGWELDPETKKPYCATLTFICGKKPKPWDIAVKWDDTCVGRFHWSEWLDDGHVFAHDGDVINARFDFQLQCERDAFAKKYGGAT